MSRRPKIVSADPRVVLKEAHQALQQAEILRIQRQYDRAESICLSLLKQFPEYFGALHTLGLVYGDKGNHQQSVHYLVQAAMLNAHSWTTLTALGGEYLLLGAKKMAIRALRDALEINSTEPAIYVTLAEVYYKRREYLLASDMYSKALELAPQMDEAILGFARVGMELGRYSEAASALEHLIDLRGPSLDMLKLIVNLPTALIRRDLLADLDKVKSVPSANGVQKEIDDAFVRATALDKMGRYEEAWNWAVKANDTVRSSINKEIVTEIDGIEHRLDWFSKNLFQFKDSNNFDNNYPKSLFILGPSRSGKTTFESIIALQAGVKRGYENPAIEDAVATGFQMGGLVTFQSLAQLPSQLYGTVRDVYRKNIKELLGDSNLLTNTSPGHIWDVPFFLKAISNMRCVFIKRDIGDLMLRIYMKHYRVGNTYSYDINVLEGYVNAYNKMIDALSETFPSVSCIINYEDMVANPAKALDEVCKLCGIIPNHSVLPQRIANDIGCAEPYRGMVKAALDDNHRSGGITRSASSG